MKLHSSKFWQTLINLCGSYVRNYKCLTVVVVMENVLKTAGRYCPSLRYKKICYLFKNVIIVVRTNQIDGRACVALDYCFNVLTIDIDHRLSIESV